MQKRSQSPNFRISIPKSLKSLSPQHNQSQKKSYTSLDKIPSQINLVSKTLSEQRKIRIHPVKVPIQKTKNLSEELQEISFNKDNIEQLDQLTKFEKFQRINFQINPKNQMPLDYIQQMRDDADSEQFVIKQRSLKQSSTMYNFSLHAINNILKDLSQTMFKDVLEVVDDIPLTKAEIKRNDIFMMCISKFEELKQELLNDALIVDKNMQQKAREQQNALDNKYFSLLQVTKFDSQLFQTQGAQAIFNSDLYFDNIKFKQHSWPNSQFNSNAGQQYTKPKKILNQKILLLQEKLYMTHEPFYTEYKNIINFIVGLDNALSFSVKQNYFISDDISCKKQKLDDSQLFFDDQVPQNQFNVQAISSFSFPVLCPNETKMFQFLDHLPPHFASFEPSAKLTFESEFEVVRNQIKKISVSDCQLVLNGEQFIKKFNEQYENIISEYNLDNYQNCINSQIDSKKIVCVSVYDDSMTHEINFHRIPSGKSRKQSTDFLLLYGNFKLVLNNALFQKNLSRIYTRQTSFCMDSLTTSLTTSLTDFNDSKEYQDKISKQIPIRSLKCNFKHIFSTEKLKNDLKIVNLNWPFYLSHQFLRISGYDNIMYKLQTFHSQLTKIIKYDIEKYVHTQIDTTFWSAAAQRAEKEYNISQAQYIRTLQQFITDQKSANIQTNFQQIVAPKQSEYFNNEIFYQEAKRQASTFQYLVNNYILQNLSQTLNNICANLLEPLYISFLKSIFSEYFSLFIISETIVQLSITNRVQTRVQTYDEMRKIINDFEIILTNLFIPFQKCPVITTTLLPQSNLDPLIIDQAQISENECRKVLNKIKSLTQQMKEGNSDAYQNIISWIKQVGASGWGYTFVVKNLNLD
ncbi:Conserved_hypothetical protein [Hexamita inflata]|uniref:Uncharacterized protein n=1 Tax=Hexamita inflata TaxID=28002 RepID=A0AA86NWH1_9EUKA|nr:Conserved hypothetical protein [Hexamita inflata]